MLFMCLLISSTFLDAYGYPRAHGCRESNRLHVVSLHPGRLDAADLVHESHDILDELGLVKAQLADARVDVPALIGPVFNLASLELADSGGHVPTGGDDRARLRGRP